MIRTIYVLTTSGSLYRAESDPVYTEKIAQAQGTTSSAAVGEISTNGNRVAITSQGIAIFSGKINEKIEDVALKEEIHPTKPVCALFLNKEDALNALNSPHLRKIDPRWHTQTKEAISAIKNHPIFILSDHPNLAIKIP